MSRFRWKQHLVSIIYEIDLIIIRIRKMVKTRPASESFTLDKEASAKEWEREPFIPG